MPNRTILIVIFVVVIVVIAAAFFLGGSLLTVSSPPDAASAASTTVSQFGMELQQVSLLAPDASSTIATDYAPYVAPSLLAQWEADPESAPGRITSSPWPDHIQIDSVTAQGAGYVVNGEIVWMTSTGPSSSTAIVVQLAQTNGAWQIVAFQEQQGS